LARIQAPQYHETVFSHIYPGKQDSGTTYIPVLAALARYLPLTAAQKQRTIVRSDAGFGADANVNQALTADWQVLGKGKGGRRPQAYAREIPATVWQDLGQERWVAPASAPVTYVRPTQHLVLRWQTSEGKTKYSTVVCSVLTWTPGEVIAHYDDRGACETEIQADKGGLKLEHRRKKHLAAQEALILLTDVAHNLLAWTPQWMFAGEPLAEFGPTRLTEEMCCACRVGCSSSTNGWSKSTSTESTHMQRPSPRGWPGSWHISATHSCARLWILSQLSRCKSRFGLPRFLRKIRVTVQLVCCVRGYEHHVCNRLPSPNLHHASMAVKGRGNKRA